MGKSPKNNDYKYPLANPFVGIPDSVLTESKGWHSLTPRARMIFITMATKVNRRAERGYIVNWSHGELSTKSGIPDTTMRRGIGELKRKRVIRVEQPGCKHYPETQYALNPYYLTGKEYREW